MTSDKQTILEKEARNLIHNISVFENQLHDKRSGKKLRGYLENVYNELGWGPEQIAAHKANYHLENL